MLRQRHWIALIPSSIIWRQGGIVSALSCLGGGGGRSSRPRRLLFCKSSCDHYAEEDERKKTPLTTSSSSDSDNVQQYYDRSRKFRMSIYHAPNIISRVVLLSDLHMDYIANREWLTNLYNNNDDNYNNNNDNKLLHQSSTLIMIAGDISHN
jgi:hypothetical protein